jgi:hypothetical protein
MRYPRFHKLMSLGPKAGWAEDSLALHDVKEVKVDAMTVCGHPDGYVDALMRLAVDDHDGPVFRADWNLVGDAWRECLVLWKSSDCPRLCFSGQVSLGWADKVPVFHDDEDGKFSPGALGLACWQGDNGSTWERVVFPGGFDFFDGMYDPILQWAAASPHKLMRFSWGYVPEEIRNCHELIVEREDEVLGFTGSLLTFEV